ncbi:unnamed protein product [Durusdinium trenchii]|uniref:Tyr recombinase domain-containing protein n=1 Tax=Durusdinium trenchii TaxID=1381693 RepID=A0ABP0M4N7_9DINO
MGSSLTGDQLTWARGVNIVQAVLNMLHGGGGQRASFITAAQTRVQARLKSGLESMMVDFEFLDKEGVQEFLKHHQHYAGGGAAIPLGERGVNGRLVYPAARTAPMGFGPSAGWAQAVTDLATEKGGLPDGRRVVPDSYPPSELPVWGSICDDIWALEHEGSGPDSLMGPRWMAAAEEAWQSFGVHPNPKKAVNADVDQEIQGIYVDSGKHWMGVSFPKRQKLLQAAVHLLAEPWVLLADVERLVGKFGYVHSCRPILRSVFAETYRWLDNNRSQGIRRAVLSDEIWIEILSASVLLPFAQFDLSADFSNRVECTDASMTGIGRAWATMPTSLVQLMAQVCDHNGTYTNMSLPHGIGLTEQGTCPLKKLNFPHQRFHWHQIGAPANPRFIYLGEADAATWSAEDRLRRPGDDGKRFVHPMDSASCVGAFNKGVQRDGDLVSCIGTLADDQGFHIVGIRVDPLVQQREASDLLRTGTFFLRVMPMLWGMVTPCPSLRPCMLLTTLAWTLTCAQCVRLGNGHPRVERFLMSALRDTTKEKYQNALQFLNNELQTAGIQWGKLSEVQQDYFLAEWMVDGYEQGLGRAEFGSLLSALGRINPRVRYKVAWKVFEVWGKLKPPQQAAAAPPELITAMMVACFALNRADLGLLICICFAGLLRVGEALQLRWKDVFLSPSGVTLCLGVTKNGIEQQVLLTNQVVADWVVQFRASQKPKNSNALLFSMSYSSVLRWVKKLAGLLGAVGVPLTTHSFRRSGASELTRRGVPFADVMLFGRWSSDRAAREYVRQGEVAILRTAEALGPGVQNVWKKWCSALPFVWHTQKLLSTEAAVPSRLKVTSDSFGRLQECVFRLQL